MSICKRLACRTGLWLGLLLLQSCGYHFGTERLPAARTVAVPVFENLTLRRGFERDLTRHVLREIKESTSYLLADEQSADLILKGSILAIGETVLVEGQRDEVLENNIELTIQVELVDGEGKGLRIRRQTGRGGHGTKSILKDRAEYIPSRGESRDTATREAMKEISERIVQILNVY